MTAITVNFSPTIELTDEQFYHICRSNTDVKFERNPTGELIILPPTGGETGKHNAEMLIDLGIWNRQTKLGVLFDSSTCFKLPNGADRSPDIAWIRQDRWDGLTVEEKEKFPAIAPDFTVELMSPSDNLKDLRSKMREYIDNQVKLGWLINRQTRQVEIYRLGQAVEILECPAQLSGENILPGLMLNLQALWG